jgi:hypothetical protein
MQSFNKKLSFRSCVINSVSGPERAPNLMSQVVNMINWKMHSSSIFQEFENSQHKLLV